MIQYYHFHSSKNGFRDIISQSHAPESTERGNTFSALAALKREGDTCFTYCPYKGECYFLQTDTRNSVFSHGFIGKIKELNTNPALYIDRFETKFSGINEESVNDAPLPSGKPFDTALYASLPKIFGDVIEALLYSDKPVILFDASKETLVNFLKVLYGVLPSKYRRTIGFCVAPDSVEQFLPGNVNDRFKSIRLVAVTSKSFYRQDGIAVFEFSNYQRRSSPQHEYAKVIETYSDDLACAEVLNFVKHVNLVAVNDEGVVDIAAMNGIAQTLLLKKDPSAERCIQILESINQSKYGEIDKAVAFAVKTLLSMRGLSPEILACIEKAVSDAKIVNTEGGAAARAAYGEYIGKYIADGSNFDDVKRNCFIAYFQNLSIAERKDFIGNIRHGKRNISSFKAFVHLYVELNYPEILELILKYVDPNEINDANVDYADEVFDEARNLKAFTDNLFSIAGNIENADAAKHIVAALIAGCVCRRTEEDKRELRKESIKTFLDSAVRTVDGKKTNKEMFSSNLEKIEYLIELHDGYMQCVRLLREEDTRDESAIKEIAEGLFGDLPSSELFSDCLYLYNKYPQIGFLCIRNIIFSRLNNFDAVKGEIFQGDNYIRYKTFIEKERAAFAIDERITGFVLSITEEQMQEERRKELSAFRQKFIADCYKYTGPAAVGWVIKEAKQVCKTDIIHNVLNQEKICVCYNKDGALGLINEELFASASFEKRLQKQTLIEKLFLQMSEDKKKDKELAKNNSTERFRMYSVIAACSLICMLLISLVFFVSQTVYAVLLGCSIVDRILVMINPIQILFIIYAGVVGAVSGITLWKYTRHDRRTSIKFCNLYMFVFAVVPAICYEAAFAIMYIK